MSDMSHWSSIVVFDDLMRFYKCLLRLLESLARVRNHFLRTFDGPMKIYKDVFFLNANILKPCEVVFIDHIG